MKETLCKVSGKVINCRLCPRLVAWRQRVAHDKVRRFADQNYWGRPVPGFGDPDAQLLVVGLAPAAHGGNRTGRIFTGDPSGDFLYRALHKAGFANQPVSVSREDGLILTSCYVTAIARCAPPENNPTGQEIENCRQYLVAELRALINVKMCVALGKMALDGLTAALREVYGDFSQPRFGHSVTSAGPGNLTIISSYHPSRRNTQTGLLTEQMFDAVFREARNKL